MTDEEFRADLLASAASRAETQSIGSRDGLVAEMLERLRDASEVPDAELCSEALTGQRSRKLEIDAFAFDEADESLHLFTAIRDGGSTMPAPLTLTDARDQGFNRLLGVFEQARDGWLTKSIEESRPLWALAKRIETEGRPAALRLHVLTDRLISERLKEIPPDRTREGVPVTFQIWDVSRLKRIHEARSARDDLVVDLTFLRDGGLAVLPAAVGVGDYTAFLAVIPGEALADIYVRHGSRLLEGNVRTYLGRRGNTNKGITATLAKEPSRFFAYNNGIAATASAVTTVEIQGRTFLTSATDLQIVNGAQTTASLAALMRDGKLPQGVVFVPMKLSVVEPQLAAELIPLISRYANTQNGVRASDFFANHAFHRRMEEISRRIFAPAAGASQVQTHWYYERARGQYLNDQAGMSASKREQFQRLNPRGQVITKTDMAKVESCFDGFPEIACKGAEKAFTSFAVLVTEEWKDDKKRAAYGDDWFRFAVARVILFRATEAIVSRAPWYEGGYRAQIVAYALARLAALAEQQSSGGRLDFRRIWNAQAAGLVLEQQIETIALAMMEVLRSPPRDGMNISEWAKQQACSKQAMESPVSTVDGFDQWLVGRDEAKAETRADQAGQVVADDLEAVKEVLALGPQFWIGLRAFAEPRRLLAAEDAALLRIACRARVPEGWQAQKLLMLKARLTDAGYDAGNSRRMA